MFNFYIFFPFLLLIYFKDGQEIVAPRKTMEELLILQPDLNIRTLSEDQTDKWETMVFSVDVNDHKVIHKIGLELTNGCKVFIGEFAIYKTRHDQGRGELLRKIKNGVLKN